MDVLGGSYDHKHFYQFIAAERKKKKEEKKIVVLSVLMGLTEKGSGKWQWGILLLIV